MQHALRSLFAFALLATLVSACALPFGARDGQATERPNIAVTENPEDGVLRPLARRIPGQDTASAPPQAAADGYLGETLAGLGAPGEAGLWLSTGLVAQTRPGRVVTESGSSLAVELRPSGAQPNAGSQISLGAMQSLGLSLGQLATLRVYVD